MAKTHITFTLNGQAVDVLVEDPASALGVVFNPNGTQ